MALYFQGDGTCSDSYGKPARTTRSKAANLAHRIGEFLLETLRNWLKSGENRRVLSKLSDHELRDLGLSREDLVFTSKMPFAVGRLPDPHTLIGNRQSDYEARRSIPGR